MKKALIVFCSVFVLVGCKNEGKQNANPEHPGIILQKGEEKKLLKEISPDHTLSSLNNILMEESAEWKLEFTDNCNNDWTQKWTLDGLIATVENTDRGMHFSAGPEFKNDAHHAVLWTKQSFKGDIKIEYNYTRTDSETNCVNILYIQAAGKGEAPFTKDISAWEQLRDIPSMRTYFENMNALHISYAAFPNTSDSSSYVRARRYPKQEKGTFDETRIYPSYDNEGYFKTGETYHITVIKTNTQLFFKIEGKESTKLYSWDLSEIDPIIDGRVGLRHMYTRSAIYQNFKIYTKS